jgi:hypothetical protein
VVVLFLPHTIFHPLWVPHGDTLANVGNPKETNNQQQPTFQPDQASMVATLLPASLTAARTPPLPAMLPSLRILHGAAAFAPPRVPLPPVSALQPPPMYLQPDEQLRIPSEQLRPPPPSPGPQQPGPDREDEDDGTESQESRRSRPPTVGDKRARRKEQCRVNQANYRKRKRQHERALAGDIATLEREIQGLMAQRSTLLLTQPTPCPDEEPEHAIASFYMAMQSPPPGGAAVGSSSTLLDLESEQFDSLEAFARAWRHHQRSFGDHFRLHVLATERFETADHAIIKMTAELEISVRDGRDRERAFVFAVQQRFELETATGRVSRVTSEVDIVAGMVSEQPSEITAAMLASLSRRGDCSWR